MLGGTLGAGVGRDGGRYGLMIDSLLSVRLVTADAQLIEVSAGCNADLFWAIRGAGANFGIVTSATYELHRIANDGSYDGHVTSIDVIFPANKSADYFDTVVDSFNGSLPANVASETLVMYDAEANAVSYIPQLQTSGLVHAYQHTPQYANRYGTDNNTTLASSSCQLGLLWARGRGSQGSGSDPKPPTRCTLSQLRTMESAREYFSPRDRSAKLPREPLRKHLRHQHASNVSVHV